MSKIQINYRIQKVKSLINKDIGFSIFIKNDKNQSVLV